MSKQLCTLGMFIIDEFEYRDINGNPRESRTRPPQIGGGGTYTVIGARVFIDSSRLGMIVDRGVDFPADIYQTLLSFGEDMWLFRSREDATTTRALNKYTGERRDFEYLTPRIRITPKALADSPKFSRPAQLHFICSPKRAADIIGEIKEMDGWNPLTIYEPIPDSCVPESLPSLLKVLPDISILSPNADEALALLGRTDGPPTRQSIETACIRFLDFGVGENGSGCVIIRSGPLGAYVARRGESGRWIDAFWQEEETQKIVDVTGAGNSFLGGLSAGLLITNGDIYEAAFYGSVAASFAIEQFGLPHFNPATGAWNDDDPIRRLQTLKARHTTYSV